MTREELVAKSTRQKAALLGGIEKNMILAARIQKTGCVDLIIEEDDRIILYEQERKALSEFLVDMYSKQRRKILEEIRDGLNDLKNVSP